VNRARDQAAFLFLGWDAPDFDVRLAKDHKQVARSGLFEQFAHRQIGVHLGRQHDQLAVALGLVADGRIEGEAADDQHVEPDALHRFLGRLFDEQRPDRAMLRTDADGRTLDDPPLSPLLKGGCRGVLGVMPLAVNPLARVGLERFELEPLVLEGV